MSVKVKFSSLIHVSFALLMVTNCLATAQARSLSGVITLDTDSAKADLPIDITVSNHSFAVVPPSFTIIRPVTSKQTRRVVIVQGEVQVDYLVEDIIDDPFTYTIRMDCVGCSSVFRRQYYSPSGNRFGQGNSVHIKPADLPASLDLTLITDASIEGKVELQSEVANKDLRFELNVSSTQNRNVVYRTLSDIVLAKNESSVTYSVTGLRRSIGNTQFRVSLRCLNCAGASGETQFFASPLSPDENHRNVDFLVSNPPLIIVSPIVDLLVSD